MFDYDFDKMEREYSLPHDIGGQAALNDFNRELFDMVQAMPSEDDLWKLLRGNPFGEKLFELITQFDDFEYNGSAKVEEDDDEN